jgi:hypothetical protein
MTVHLTESRTMTYMKTRIHYTYLSVIRVNAGGVAFAPRIEALTNQDLADQVRSQLERHQAITRKALKLADVPNP